MKKLVWFVILYFIAFNNKHVFSFENEKTHPSLTHRAINASLVDDYLRTQLNLSSGTTAELTWNFPSSVEKRIKAGNAEPYKKTRSILEWLKVGSNIEDMTLGQLRYRKHFHDPTRNSGLNNTEADYWLSGRFIGASAKDWAINDSSNEFNWRSTRNDFYHALNESSKPNREKFLAITFLKLGHILHMIEDMGVPAHSRNDALFAHVRSLAFEKGNPLEMWAEGQVAAAGNNIPANWLTGWTPTPKVFDKVANYFDTDTRNTGSYLGDGVSPPAAWGLAEATNYQFFSWSTISPDTGSLYYFPHPDINRCSVIEESGRTYLSGYAVDHLAMFTMSEDILEHGHLEQAWCTLGETIYNDYVRITIPRTIDYVTGLANYFFRGRLSVEPNWADPNIAELVITNDSNNSGVPQALKGGEFELYWDGTDGNRAEVNNFEVSGWGTESVLDYNDTVTATFTREANAAAYTLVYQGQICENPSEPDPCDANAIAVAVFRPGYSIIAWGRDNEGQVSGVPDGNDYVAVAAGNWYCLAMRSDGSLVGWGRNNYGQCDVPAGNDYTAISAGHYHSIALKSDGSIVVWGRDNLNQVTNKPDGNDFVAIAAGDYHSLAIKKDGTIVGWGGWNSYGECNAPLPDAGTVYIDIAAGSYHSLALQSDGVVKAWGNNNFGQTRIYDGASGRVHEAVAAGGNYSFLLGDDDVLISWGGGDWLSPGIPLYHYRLADGNDFTVIAAGTDHIMALTSDGKVFDWNWPVGDFPFDYFDRPVPVDVVFTEDIDGGYDFSAALRLP